ncbi:hypothetical protein JMUB7538_27300 [Staphylococcus aureus]
MAHIQPDLVALFVVVTGVFGMAIGDVLFLRLSCLLYTSPSPRD